MAPLDEIEGSLNDLFDHLARAAMRWTDDELRAALMQLEIDGRAESFAYYVVSAELACRFPEDGVGVPVEMSLEDFRATVMVTHL